MRAAIARGATVHTGSDFVAHEIADEFALAPERIVRIYTGIASTTGGDVRAGRSRAGCERYVLALGQIEPRKNLPMLVQAFDRIAGDDPDLGLVVAGPDGWDAERFAAACAAATHSGRIHRLGYVSDADRRDLLAGCAVFAYPSVYEGFGHPPLEAMQAGVPVVASDAGSLPEVLGDAALLADPHDVDDLAGAADARADRRRVAHHARRTRSRPRRAVPVVDRGRRVRGALRPRRLIGSIPALMDICVCGAQVPFMRGGAELLTENLVGALQDAGHRAELIRLPTAWDGARIFDAALAWRLVPIDADLVIATNFPSYFVRHPRKVVWLLHQHRGAYDGAGEPWSDFDLSVEALEAQRLLTEWDDRALAEAKVLYTCSRVVSDRLARFNGIDAEPLYHPAPLQAALLALTPGPTDDLVFSATRLEHNKRPELLIEAARELRGGTRVVIAGRGTRTDEMHDLVRRHNLTARVELPGFVPDDALVARFGAARAVVYTPRDEDYGYVTLQAFAAGKPVITTSDAGGVLEWVEDGVTGLVADPTPHAIAGAIDRLVADPELAAALGKAGRARVADLDMGPGRRATDHPAGSAGHRVTVRRTSRSSA